MKNMVEMLNRIRSMVPPGVEPKFKTGAEWMEWQRVEGAKRSAQIDEQNRKVRAEKIFGRSGICELHRNCSFDNFHVTTDGQRQALDSAKKYAEWFGTGFASFVFTGGCGTGKNHLAAAIGNALLHSGRSVLIVTVPDLMLRARACYDEGRSESMLLSELCAVDLLVLDEVGVQRETKNEFVLLNQIIDRRLASMKPVGILTNQTISELTQTLGVRIMDRLTMDDGMWVKFEWGSYRKKVSHLRLVK